jgi:UDP-N-acetyl-D-mannosaminuronate dehydrogenase
VVHLLNKADAITRAFEPFKPAAALPGVDSVPTLELALQEAEAVLLLVNHTQFKQLDPQKLQSLTPARVLIDTVNNWIPAECDPAGFRLFRLGVGK